VRELTCAKRLYQVCVAILVVVAHVVLCCAWASIYECIYSCIYIYICMYIDLYKNIYTYIYRIYIHMYFHIYITLSRCRCASRSWSWWRTSWCAVSGARAPAGRTGRAGKPSIKVSPAPLSETSSSLSLPSTKPEPWTLDPGPWTLDPGP